MFWREAVLDVGLEQRVIWNPAFQQIVMMTFVECGQSLGRNPVAVPVAQLRDGRLKPTLFDPEDYFFRSNAHCLSQSVQRNAVTTDLADTQLSPLESVPKCLGAPVQPFGDLLYREFGEEFPRFVEFFRMPSAVVGLGLDSVLDNEAPTFVIP